MERSLTVAARLRPWIAEIATSRLSAESIVFEAPDHATTVTLRTAPGGPPQLMIMGPRSRALFYHGEPGPSCLKVRLQPGRARLLLGRSVRDLVDQAVPVREVWDTAGRPAESWDDLDGFVAALLDGVPVGPDPHGELIGRAAGLLPTNDVQTSAKRLHISERHLRNLFVDRVGMPPKRFARIDRVRTVLREGASRPWSELALAVGYSDHSHMTAEFRAIMGVPPTAFFSGRAVANTNCRRSRQSALGQDAVESGGSIVEVVDGDGGGQVWCDRGYGLAALGGEVDGAGFVDVIDAVA